MPVNNALKKTVFAIDYPRRNERVTSPQYTIRVSAPAHPLTGDRVEVSIDDSPFAHCRFAAGYWWYDWTGYAAREHQLVARMITGDRVIKTARRSVVEFEREKAAA